MKKIMIRPKFQFYDSPIKNTLFDDGLPAPAEFQFYDSPIKRIPARNSIIVAATFQFYDSPIKRFWTVRGYNPVEGGFNSMIVRLKAAFFFR